MHRFQASNQDRKNRRTESGHRHGNQSPKPEPQVQPAAGAMDIDSLYRRIRDHYEPRLDSGGSKHDMLDWASCQSQFARFLVLAKLLQKNDQKKAPRLLDVGCGFAELAFFLRRQNLDVQYTGIDLVPGFMRTAKEQDERLDLVVGDVFHQSPFTIGFDYVFCSGTLNLKTTEHEAFVRLALAAMIKLSRRCLVVNFLHWRTVEKYDHCYYCRPEDAIAMLPGDQQEKTEIIDDYLDNDFTLIVRKQQNSVY